MSVAEPTARKQRDEVLREHAFKPGQSGNPAGRSKGSRNKLGEEFVKDILADWQEHGIETIKKVREDRPADYLKVVASILPKDINFRVGDLEDLSDDELAGELATIAAQLAGEGGGVVARIAAAIGRESSPRKSSNIH